MGFLRRVAALATTGFAAALVVQTNGAAA